MKKILIAPLAILCFLSTTPVFSETAYAGVTYTNTKLQFDFTSSEANIGSLVGKYGYYINDYVQAEFRLGLGVNDGELFGADVSIDSLVGGYIRVSPDLDRFTPYLIVGFTDIEVGLGSGAGSDSDVSYGIGTDIDVNETWAINLEFIQYQDKDGVSLPSAAIGAVMKF